MPQLRLDIAEDLKSEIQSYADTYGIALADAVRILLRKGLASENGDAPGAGLRRVPRWLGRV